MGIVKRKASTGSIVKGNKSDSMDKRVRDSVMGASRDTQTAKYLSQNKKKGKLR